MSEFLSTQYIQWDVYVMAAQPVLQPPLSPLDHSSASLPPLQCSASKATHLYGTVLNATLGCSHLQLDGGIRRCRTQNLLLDLQLKSKRKQTNKLKTATVHFSWRIQNLHQRVPRNVFLLAALSHTGSRPPAVLEHHCPLHGVRCHRATHSSAAAQSSVMLAGSLSTGQGRSGSEAEVQEQTS